MTQPNARRKIVIDTDPGIDDALAILFALRSPELEVVGFTSIFGNCDTHRSTLNVERLQRFATAPSPVGFGAQTPLFGPTHPYADFVHGRDGLGDVGLAGDRLPDRSGHAAQLIVDTVMAHPGEVTIVALGPLTNLALALALEPRVAEATAEVVIMGGAYGVNGNVTPAAEANIIHDAYAAELVLAAAWPTTLITLDVTNHVLMTPAYLDDLGAKGGTEGHFLREVTRFYQQFHADHGRHAIYAHDPTAMMFVVAPELFTLDEAIATVVTGGPAHGQTLLDRRGPTSAAVDWSGRTPIRFGLRADADALLDLYRSRFV